jgi:hypothetical protein
MTDPNAGDPDVEDIEDGADAVSARLDRQADAILRNEGMRSLGVRPLRQALREDAASARTWGTERAQRLRRAVQDEPVRATIWALGLGLLIGLLAAR